MLLVVKIFPKLNTVNNKVFKCVITNKCNSVFRKKIGYYKKVNFLENITKNLHHTADNPSGQVQQIEVKKT